MEGKKHEIGALCILVATLLVFFSVISYDSKDPTPFTSSALTPPSNWIGTFGAILALGLMYVFGITAYLLPPLGFWISWALLRGLPVLPYGRMQSVGIALILVSLMSLAPLISHPAGEITLFGCKIRTGCFMGTLFADFLRSNLHILGAYILLTGTLLTGLMIATPFSLQTALDLILRVLSVTLHTAGTAGGRLVRSGAVRCGDLCRRGLRRRESDEVLLREEDVVGEETVPAAFLPMADNGNGMADAGDRDALGDDARVRDVRGRDARGRDARVRGNGRCGKQAGLRAQSTVTDTNAPSLESESGPGPNDDAGVDSEPVLPEDKEMAEESGPPTAPVLRIAKKEQGGDDAALFSPQPPSPGQYSVPDLRLLDTYEEDAKGPDPKLLERNARILEEKLADFGVQGQVADICPGPVITLYEYTPAPGIKISRIVSLTDDLAMALRAISIRVVAPIPGKAAIGIEIPNKERELVSIRTILESDVFMSSKAPLTIALGKDTTGRPATANLAKMPHLLIAGATGTGKSVCINTVLSSLLYRNTPNEMRILLIDPKRIELSSYEGIPHLIHPVVTDAKLATKALRWAVQEMEMRYKLIADKNARNIESYNNVLAKENEARNRLQAVGPESGPEFVETGGIEENVVPADPGLRHHHMPYMVIIIDELADLMMVASREVEESIMRLAQMARAAGIHLILATQRPSVDVLTGVIKANIPTRISFQVSSRIDSRTILDTMGAENLLGAGDMLFLPPGTAKLQRIHGAFISEAEVQRLTQFWRSQQLVSDPLRERVNFQDDSSSNDIGEDDLDEKYEQAVQVVMETRQASISMLQRRLRVGYNRAARMIDVMEMQGIVGPSDGVKPREVYGPKVN